MYNLSWRSSLQQCRPTCCDSERRADLLPYSACDKSHWYTRSSYFISSPSAWQNILRSRVFSCHLLVWCFFLFNIVNIIHCQLIQDQVGWSTLVQRDNQASITLSLDLCPEFMRDGGGAGLISISHFTTIFANFRGYKCWKIKIKMRQVSFHI